MRLKIEVFERKCTLEIEYSIFKISFNHQCSFHILYIPFMFKNFRVLFLDAI